MERGRQRRLQKESARLTNDRHAVGCPR